VLVVPALEKGRGGGHLVRSLTLAEELENLRREAWLFVPAEAEERYNRIRGVAASGSPGPSPRVVRDRRQAAGKQWDLIVLDRFRTPPEEFAFWYGLAPVIGIDEGGECRKGFDFLIDLLPRLPDREGANITDLSLLPLPRRRRPSFHGNGPAAAPKILVSFGAEDPAGLAGMVSRALGLPPPGPLPGLREHLAGYDLMVTHFGLGAFEALHARVPVLLVSPGPYHEGLAKNADLFSAGIGAGGCRRAAALLGGGERAAAFRRTLALRCEAAARRYGLEEKPSRSLGSFIDSLRPMGTGACPVCGSPSIATSPAAADTPPAVPPAAAGGAVWRTIPAGAHPVLARFPDRGYRRCSRCGMVYMVRLNPPSVEYGEDYFFGAYKKQYGKTYLEDFSAIAAQGKRRLGIIKPILAGQAAVPERANPGGGPAVPPPEPSAAVSPPEPAASGLAAVPGPAAPALLDIGCACGPFLQAALEEGFRPLGIDPAAEAVAHVRENLGLEALQGFFPGDPGPEILEGRRFDVVSLWYVIEHFPDPGKALDAIRRILKPGGVLAFSTPSLLGVSGRRSLKGFLEKSPPDHFTLWDPRRCGELLRRKGFILKKIVVSGHHPERFPLAGPLASGGKGLYRPLLALSRLFRLGDTFEVYAAAVPENRREET
jgi:SAM-dependent methyltransferase